MQTIQEIRAHEILDSRGNPTVSVTVQFGNGHIAEASVPSGASTGKRETFELRDRDAHRYGGMGVLEAVRNVNEVLGPHLRGMEVTQQAALDKELKDFDGTPNKSRFGANAILGISLAVARAGARASGMPLYRYLAQLSGRDDSAMANDEPTPFVMPVPMMNVLNGGAHASNTLDFQEFMIFPIGAPTFAEALRYGAETFHALKRLLGKRELSTAVGDEGGFAPDLETHEEALDLIVEAIELAGYEPGKDIAIALDPAVSELFENGAYHFHKSRQRSRTAAEMMQLFRDWAKWYPIVSIEDAMAEDDTAGWQALTRELGSSLQLVGDDNFVSNPGLLAEGVRNGVANAVLVKVEPDRNPD